jgi:uncharacterized protein YndB with AHSA1/START domain
MSIATYEITLNRTIAATPDEVYDAWLDPSIPCNPWSGSARIDWTPKVNGLWYFLHIMDSKKTSPPLERPHFGRFVTLERGKKIQLDWMSYNTCGLESVVTATFKAQGEDTLLTLNHSNIPDNELGRAHEGGWAFLTSKLEQKFAKT